MITAIKAAMEMEANIRDIYAQACDNCSDPAGRRVFEMLRDDEQYHFDYLTMRLAEIEQNLIMSCVRAIGLTSRSSIWSRRPAHEPYHNLKTEVLETWISALWMQAIGILIPAPI